MTHCPDLSKVEEKEGLAAVTVLIIRAHKRFAICRRARLRRPGRRGIDGLLIEISLEGCRLSHVAADAGFAPDQSVSLRIVGAAPIEARVRWLGDRTLGLRFARPLSFAALESLIRLCRAAAEPVAQAAQAPQALPAYGT